MFTLHIETDNAAFDEGGKPHFEVARLLRELATRIERLKPNDGGIRDNNGNKVGNFTFEVAPSYSDIYTLTEDEVVK